LLVFVTPQELPHVVATDSGAQQVVPSQTLVDAGQHAPPQTTVDVHPQVFVVQL
jgi:hypothetical protein